MHRNPITILLALLACTAANAQTNPAPNPVDLGLTGYHDYHGGSIDHINLDNGNMVLTIPVVSYPQRGGSLKLGFDLTYNGTGLTFYQDYCGTTQDTTLCNSGWFPATQPPNTGSGSYAGTPNPFAGGLGLFDMQDIAIGAKELPWSTEDPGFTDPFVEQTVWYTPDGATHPAGQLENSQGALTGQLSLDGSGIQAGFTWPTTPQAEAFTSTCTWDCPSTLPGVAAGQNVIATRDGITYFGPGSGAAWGRTQAGLVRMDADGNYISSTGSGYTDTVGRSIPYPTTVGSPTAQQLAASGCPSGTTVFQTWTPPGYSTTPTGYSAPFTFCYATVTLSLPSSTSTSIAGGNANIFYKLIQESATLLQSLILPNGQAWTFGYTESVTNCPLYSKTGPVNIGDLTQITFPAGGTISYGYTCVYSGNQQYTTAVSSRTVNANDGTGPHTWMYTYANDSVFKAGTVTVTDPLGNDMVQALTSSAYTPGESNPANDTRVTTYYSGSSASGAVLKTDTRVYPPQYATWNGFPLYPSSETVVENGSSTQTLYQYCCDFSFHGEPVGVAPYAASYGKMTDAKVYDYTGALLRETSTGYLFQTNASYLNPGFFDLTSSEKTLNTAGAQVALTTYGYDQTSRNLSGIGTQTSTPLYAGVWGHETTKTDWLNAGGNSPTTTTTYWDTGEVYQVTDPLANSTSPAGNPTTYSYSPAYAGSLPTSVANPLGQTATSTYDLETGHKVTVTDPNSQPTTYTYSDPLNRLTDILYPDVYPGTSTHGETQYCYNDTAGECGGVGPANAVLVTQAMSPTASKVQEVDVDGFGRKQHLRLTDPAGNDVVDFTYDALGRAGSVSNPYRTASDATYGITSFSYDALGRKTYQCNPDNSSSASTTCVPSKSYQSWSYNGNTVTFQDENGNQWQRTSDALGRLTKVLEPNGANQAPYMETDYGYDALGNLISAKQWGGPSGTPGAVLRTFNYDSMSRLMCAANPETSAAGAACPATASSSHTAGTTGYGYDANGNMTSMTDAIGAVTTQTFDAINRLKSQTYSTGDPGKVYIYDQKGTNTVGRLTYEASTGAGTLLSAHFINVYDAMGRIKAEGSCTITTCGTGSTPTYPYYLTYNYDLAGNLTTSSPGLSGDPVLTYSYNAAGQLQQITSSWNDATIHPQTLFLANSTSSTSPAYSPFGTLENAQFSIFSGSQTPNILLNRAYDNRGRIRSGTYSAPTAGASASKSSGSLTISGSEQSLPIPATSGSGSVTIKGHETTSGCPTPEDTILCHYDQGTITITVNGFAASVGYGQTSTTVSVAAALASALNASGSPVTASYGAQLPNAEIFMTAKSSGASTNYSLSATALEGSSSQPSPSFSAVASGSALLGGAASAGTTYDSGALTVTVNNIAATASYGQGSSPSGIASSIASAINSAASSIVTATANGASVSLASTQAASSTNWPLAASVASSSPSTFPAASFSVSATGMSGGADAGSTTTTTLYSYNLNGFATLATNPGYDSVGNVVGLQDSVVGQWKFGYDTLNRLQSATGISGSFNGINVSAASQGWTYDSFGNRTGQSAGSSQTPTQWATFTPAAANNRVATSNGAPGGLSYDGDGRLLNDGAKAYLWEMQGWLCGVTSAGNHYQYIYDAEGRLVTTASRPDAQCGLNTTTLADYIVDQFGRQITEADGSARWRHTNVYANGELLATYDGVGLHYALNDWLGDKRVQVLASSTGSTVEETCWNLPFNDGFGCSGTGTDATEQHYTGKEHDKYVSQLDHFGARSYTQYSGRFISPDWSSKPEDVPYSDIGNPQSLNLYAYVGNNPLSRRDADGHLMSLAQAMGWGGGWGSSGGEALVSAAIGSIQGNMNADLAQQQVSQAGQDFIKGYEKLSLTVYDASGKRKAGDWTIGYGHKTTKDAGPITLPEAEALFQGDVARMASHVSADLNVPVSQNQFDALVSLRFNAGANAITPPVADLNSTGHATMGDFTNHYITAGGVPSRGLELRRAAEWRIFSEGVYDASH